MNILLFIKVRKNSPRHIVVQIFQGDYNGTFDLFLGMVDRVSVQRVVMDQFFQTKVQALLEILLTADYKGVLVVHEKESGLQFLELLEVQMEFLLIILREILH